LLHEELVVAALALAAGSNDTAATAQTIGKTTFTVLRIRNPQPLPGLPLRHRSYQESGVLGSDAQVRTAGGAVRRRPR
jgi:hypothetical protein